MDIEWFLCNKQNGLTEEPKLLSRLPRNNDWKGQFLLLGRHFRRHKKDLKLLTEQCDTISKSWQLISLKSYQNEWQYHVKFLGKGGALGVGAENIISFKIKTRRKKALTHNIRYKKVQLSNSSSLCCYSCIFKNVSLVGVCSLFRWLTGGIFSAVCFFALAFLFKFQVVVESDEWVLRFDFPRQMGRREIQI